MTKLAKWFVGASLVTAMVLGTVAGAAAAPALTLTSTRSSVTYPQPTWLKLVAADGAVSVPTTVTIQLRHIGDETWTNYRRIAASRTAEGTVTVPVSPFFLRSITGFRAVAVGLESEVTTVAVKARLSAAKAPMSVKARRRVTVKGFIWPRHAAGTRPVNVTIWKWEGGGWVEKGTVHPKIVGKTADGSKWQFTRQVGADDKGTWRLQVSHEDMKHAASTSRYSYIRVR
jgi:hypothetical protein